MPPKCKYTKEEIVSAAVELVRTGGLAALSARSLAEKLGTSAKPIFVQFCGMEEVEKAVLEKAEEIYLQFLQIDMQSGKYPPYKGGGMGYIRFAKEERELFKLLFMREREPSRMNEAEDSFEMLVDVVQQQLELSKQDAIDFHASLWIYVHGFATMIATGFREWDEETVSAMISDVYLALKSHYQTKGSQKNG